MWTLDLLSDEHVGGGIDGMWQVALSATGAAGLGAFVLWSLYRHWLTLPIFARLTRRQTFSLMVMFLVFTFSGAVLLVVLYFLRPPTSPPPEPRPTVQSSVTVHVTGPGTVATDAGGRCSTSCVVRAREGATLVLIALPDEGKSMFSGWAGECQDAGTSNECRLLVGSLDHNLEARFEPLHTLHIVLRGTGNVAITPRRGPTSDCPTDGADCSVQAATDTFHLVAEPNPGQVFVRWEPPCLASRDLACDVHLTALEGEATAVFGSNCLSNFLVSEDDGRLLARRIWRCRGQLLQSKYGTEIAQRDRSNCEALASATSGQRPPAGSQPCPD